MASRRDEHVHEMSDDPFWSESAFFTFTVPERNLSAEVYIANRPNRRYALGGVFIWLPGNDSTLDCLHYDFREPDALIPGAEVFDFAPPTGLTVSCAEPQRSYRFSYRGPDWYRGLGCELELEWKATGGTPDTGRMTGILLLQGERIEVSCESTRGSSTGAVYVRNRPHPSR